MPDAGSGTEFASYTAYDIEAPVGRTIAELGTNAGNVVAAAEERIVLCVSCHRAHGSPYADPLRWDYANMDVGTTSATYAGTGCFACHSFKDGL